MGTVQDQLWRFQGLLKEAEKQKKARNEAEQRYQSLQLQYEREKESRTKAETVSKEEMQARVTMEKLYEGEKQARLNDKLDSNMLAQSLPAKVEAPLLSVVMVSYNDEENIGAAIESVLKQDTSQRWELIIVDDDSTDLSYSIARRYASKFPGSITTVRQRHSGTPASGRNLGFSMARADWVLPLDADDLLADNAIAECMKLTVGTSYNVVIGDMQLIGNFEHMPAFSFPDHRWACKPYDSQKELEVNMIHNSALVRRDLWVAVGGYSTVVPYYEDWLFWRQIDAAVGLKPICTGKLALLYRQGAKASNLKASSRNSKAEQHNVHFLDDLLATMTPQIFTAEALSKKLKNLESFDEELMKIYDRDIAKFPSQGISYFWKALMIKGQGHFAQSVDLLNKATNRLLPPYVPVTIQQLLGEVSVQDSPSFTELAQYYLAIHESSPSLFNNLQIAYWCTTQSAAAMSNSDSDSAARHDSILHSIAAAAYDHGHKLYLKGSSDVAFRTHQLAVCATHNSYSYKELGELHHAKGNTNAAKMAIELGKLYQPMLLETLSLPTNHDAEWALVPARDNNYLGVIAKCTDIVPTPKLFQEAKRTLAIVYAEDDAGLSSLTIKGTFHYDMLMFADVARSLGHSVVITSLRECMKSWNCQTRKIIVFAPHLISAAPLLFAQLQTKHVVIQMEQLAARNSKFTSEIYMNYLARDDVAIWDFSHLNLDFVHTTTKKAHPENDHTFPYVLSPLAQSGASHEIVKDIDVLVFGLMNKERHQVVKEIQALGHNVVFLEGVYPPALGTYLARANVVLNIHYYRPAGLEVNRIYSSLVHGSVVISENVDDKLSQKQWSGAVLFVDTLHDMVTKANQVLKDPSLLQHARLKAKTVLSSRSNREDFEQLFRHVNTECNPNDIDFRAKCKTLV